MTLASPPLRVVLLGLGNVGRAVALGLLDGDRRLPFQLVAVGVREPDRARGVELPEDIELSDDLPGLIAHHDPDVVVELLGGVHPAHELVAARLLAARAVVTANKALLAACGPQLESISRQGGGRLRFEAAVAGGIPVLGPLGADLAANRFSQVRGIINGTTNFILSAMVDEGREYADVLADAQRRGYAEADPTADVEGMDAAAKLVILARLALGQWQSQASVLRCVPAFGGGDARPGITCVGAADISGARARGLRIRLVARAERTPVGIGLAVTPAAVPEASLLGRTSGVTNVVEVIGTPVGRVAAIGPGAGGAATSSAVLGDLLALARGSGSTWGDAPEAPPLPPGPLAGAGPTLADHHQWLVPRGDGSATVEDGSLDEIRRRLSDAVAVEQPLYPVLEGD